MRKFLKTISMIALSTVVGVGISYAATTGKLQGVLRDARAKRYFEKPSDEKRRKSKLAAFNNMVRLRYENR